jgi:AraC-like DNA-binding protein
VIVVSTPSEYGVYGFRFAEQPQLALCNLYAVGWDRVHSPAYRWDGLTRNDGPLLLFQYTIEGEGILEWQNRKERIGPGHAFLVEIPGEHQYYYEGEQGPWEFCFLLFRPNLIHPLWEQAKTVFGATPELPSASLPVRLLRDIFMEARSGRITDAYLASSYVYQFVTELCRFAASGNRRQEGWPDKIKMAVAFIEAHYGSMVSLDELAEHLKLSKYHLLRTFTAMVGLTPNDYLNRVRIEHAMELLRQSEMSIEEIARRIGYSSGSYFIKVFKGLTGLTPGAFRSGDESLLFNRLFFD